MSDFDYFHSPFAFSFPYQSAHIFPHFKKWGPTDMSSVYYDAALLLSCVARFLLVAYFVCLFVLWLCIFEKNHVNTFSIPSESNLAVCSFWFLSLICCLECPPGPGLTMRFPLLLAGWLPRPQGQQTWCLMRGNSTSLQEEIIVVRRHKTTFWSTTKCTDNGGPIRL